MQSRYEIAREFCVAGRIMFLRPVKHKARVKRKTRRYQPVWISPEVQLHNRTALVLRRACRGLHCAGCLILAAFLLVWSGKDDPTAASGMPTFGCTEHLVMCCFFVSPTSMLKDTSASHHAVGSDCDLRHLHRTCSRRASWCHLA